MKFQLFRIRNPFLKIRVKFNKMNIFYFVFNKASIFVSSWFPAKKPKTQKFPRIISLKTEKCLVSFPLYSEMILQYLPNQYCNIFTGYLEHPFV